MRNYDIEIEFEKAREKVLDMLWAYDPPPKTWRNCNRMRYLALLAMETIEKMEEASKNDAPEIISRQLAEYSKRYQQVTEETK